MATNPTKIYCLNSSAPREGYPIPGTGDRYYLARHPDSGDWGVWSQRRKVPCRGGRTRTQPERWLRVSLKGHPGNQRPAFVLSDPNHGPRTVYLHRLIAQLT